MCKLDGKCHFAFSVAAGSWEEVKDYITIFNAYGACVMCNHLSLRVLLLRAAFAYMPGKENI